MYAIPAKVRCHECDLPTTPTHPIVMVVGKHNFCFWTDKILIDPTEFIFPFSKDNPFFMGLFRRACMQPPLPQRLTYSPLMNVLHKTLFNRGFWAAFIQASFIQALCTFPPFSQGFAHNFHPSPLPQMLECYSCACPFYRVYVQVICKLLYLGTCL